MVSFAHRHQWKNFFGDKLHHTFDIHFLKADDDTDSYIKVEKMNGFWNTKITGFLKHTNYFLNDIFKILNFQKINNYTFINHLYSKWFLIFLLLAVFVYFSTNIVIYVVQYSTKVTKPSAFRKFISYLWWNFLLHSNLTYFKIQTVYLHV